MRTADWTRRIFQQDETRGLKVRQPEGISEWASLTEEARPALVAASFLAQPRTVLLVTSNYDRCLRWQSKLVLCGVPEADIHQLPSGLSALFEDAAPEHFALSDRIGALEAFVAEQACIVITTAPAALERTLPKSILQEAFVELSTGMSAEPEKLLRKLVRLGYERQEPVRQPGHYSRRGGILDLFAMGRELPIRVEFFGNEIESIRQFDPVSQRSVGAVSSLSLAPSRETLYPKDVAEFGSLMRHALEQEAPQLEPGAAATLEELVEGDIEAIGRRAYFDRLDLYRPWIHPDAESAIHLLGEGDLLILEEPSELDAHGSRAYEELGQAMEARANRGEMLRAFASDFMEPVERLGEFARTLSMTAMNDAPEWLAIAHRQDWNAVGLQAYRGNPSALAQTLKNWKKDGVACVICTDQPNRAKSVLGGVDVFPAEVAASGSEGLDLPGGSDASDRSAESSIVSLPSSIDPGFYLSHGNLAGGFIFPDAKIAFLTDAEIFGVGRLRLPQKRFLEGAPIATLLDLKPGDYVVHIQFGIGIYRGLAKREVDGVEKEFLYIEYEAPDKLFVPADQLDRVQKYLNPGDAAPKLNRLRGQEWQRTISKARENARAFASELVKLYAQRSLVQRRPYGPDTPWQAELEATFPWVETPSQLLAAKAVKCDLRNDYPMDRLVCGDVGFGKTEVAIRGAFKVVQEGRQAAVLCPTTILSEQHFRNFQERMEPFGTRLALLNRFVKSAQRNQTLRDLEAGKVDVVIGTHAVLGQDVKFKELGLLVVDEEQKFGVKQKEQIKKLKTAVDVLTLSATPIPRTLSMALMDIRQMSLINDPPPGRLPIRTFLRTHSNEVVREAILREMARGGQVFYVYNRIEGIYHVAERLLELVPTARIAVGHGQMPEQELEPVMLSFIHGEVDVLISTTIVESGLDIPNVNTLIVENADRFGLSQLYQLRGRVGRSDRQAYAYFLYQSNREITDQAMQRLQALQEFSALGSGYSLAFRDLQIRGAGELLGAKQHGAMATVGYELYTQLIQDAVAKHKASMIGALADTQEASAEDAETMAAQMEPLPPLDLPVAALLPEGYISDQAQRLYYYQRLMTSKDEAGLGEAQGEIEDRYGHPPEPARNAFRLMALRMTMRKLKISKIDGSGGRLAIGFKERQKVPPMALSTLGRKNRECYLTRESLIWPYTGNPIDATERMLRLFGECLEEVRAAATHHA